VYSLAREVNMIQRISTTFWKCWPSPLSRSTALLHRPALPTLSNASDAVGNLAGSGLRTTGTLRCSIE